jgi:hypothetical protein
MSADITLVQINGESVRSLFTSAQLALLILKNVAYILFQSVDQSDRERVYGCGRVLSSFVSPSR